MKKLLSLLSLVVVCAALSMAQSNAAAAEKAAAASSVATQFVVSTASFVVTPFVDVLSTSIKPPGGKDLFITFSAQTLVAAASVNNDLPVSPFTFTAENVGIQVRILLDGNPVLIAPPSLLSILTYDNLVRTTQRFTPGQIDFLTLVTQEGGVRSFSWVARDVGVGVHTIDVQARFVFSNARFPLNTQTFSQILAVLGAKTLTVEEVKLD